MDTLKLQEVCHCYSCIFVLHWKARAFITFVDKETCVKQIRACGFFHLFPSIYMSFRIDHSQCDDRSWFVLEESRAGLSRGFQERSNNSAHAEMAAGQYRDRPAVTRGTSREQGSEHEVAEVLSQTDSACVLELSKSSVTPKVRLEVLSEGKGYGMGKILLFGHDKCALICVHKK